MVVRVSQKKLDKLKKPYERITAREAAKERIRIETEMKRQRNCPTPGCEKKFTWRNTKNGQIHCSNNCALNDPDRGGGRPTIMKDDVLLKLKYAFSVDATNEEACLYAGISISALYVYEKQNPEFKEEKKQLKTKMVLNARVKVFNDISQNVETAKWLLERKRKNEFATKSIHTGEVFTGEMDPEHKKRAKEILRQMDED